MSDQTQPMPKKGAMHLSDADLQKTLEESTMPVFVDFYAEWCGPCKLAGPVIDKLAEEFQGKVMIVKIDVDPNPMSSKQYGVMSIPTTILFNKVDGKVKEIDRKIGFAGEQGYRQMLAKVMGK